MARPRRSGHGEHRPADLFSIDPTSYLPMALASRPWPDPARFPVNHAGGHVRQQVWADLVGSPDPVVVAGFSSIGELIDLAAAWAHRQREGSLRVLLGSEPFATERSSFASAEAALSVTFRRRVRPRTGHEAEFELHPHVIGVAARDTRSAWRLLVVSDKHPVAGLRGSKDSSDALGPWLILVSTTRSATTPVASYRRS